MSTPANLRAIRLRTGLKDDEAAQILGLDRASYVRQERAKTFNVYENSVDTLWAIQEAMRSEMTALNDRLPDILVTYMNDDDFIRYEPVLSKRIHFNSAHRMMMAQFQQFLREEGTVRHIVELIPDEYEGWCTRYGRRDSVSSREKWALEKVTRFIWKPKERSE